MIRLPILLLSLLLYYTPADDPWLPLGEGYTWIYKGPNGERSMKRVTGRKGSGWIVENALFRARVIESKDGLRVEELNGRPASFLLLPANPRLGEEWSGWGAGIAFTFRCAAVAKERLSVSWQAGDLAGLWKFERGRGIVEEKLGDRRFTLADFRKGDLQPIGKGYTWTYDTDYDIPMIYQVIRTEKVGEVMTFVLDHNMNERSMQIEWLAPTRKGLVLHAHKRGRNMSKVPRPFLRLPVAPLKGDKWTGLVEPGIGAKQKQSYVCRGAEEVKVPAGTFRAVKVDMEFDSGEEHRAEGTAWYAPGVGMVKYEMSIFLPTGGASFEYELRKFKR